MAVITNSTKTLADMRNQVYFLIAESPNSRIFGTENVDRAINMGLSQASHLYNRTVVRADTETLAGEATYAIPDVSMQLGRALVDRVLVDGVEIEALDYPSYSDETGQPTGYHVTGNSFTLSPTPDAAYRIDVDYRQEVAPLVEDTDKTWLPDVAVDAAVMYACYLMKLKDEEYRSADNFLAQYDNLLKLLTRLQTGVYRYEDDARYGGPA